MRWLSGRWAPPRVKTLRRLWLVDCSAGVFGRAKGACLCLYCCNRHLWCYDGGRLGRVKIATLRVGAPSPAFSPLFWSFNMALSRAKHSRARAGYSRTDLLSQGKTMVWKLRKTSFHHAKMLWPLVWPRNFKQNIQTAKSLNFQFPISNCVKYRTKKTEPISLISLPENRRNNTRKLIQLF